MRPVPSQENCTQNENIYINKNLAKRLKALYWKTKQLAKKKKAYKFVWTFNGKIYVRKGEGTAVIRIETDNDFTKLN